jgi:hypothetical protein
MSLGTGLPFLGWMAESYMKCSPLRVDLEVLDSIEHVEGSISSFCCLVAVTFAIVSSHSPGFGLTLTDLGSTEKLVQSLISD